MADLIWGQHLAQFADPIEGIKASSAFALGMLGERGTILGCPINNLAQEMSAIDEDFRIRLEAVFRGIIANIAGALRRGKADGVVRADVDCDAAAIFIFAGIEGIIGLAKSTRSADLFEAATKEAESYLETLRRRIV
jgi:hypothetical protein